MGSTAGDSRVGQAMKKHGSATLCRTISGLDEAKSDLEKLQLGRFRG